MKFVDQKAELYFEPNPYLKVLRAGKTCYQSMKNSDDEDSAKKFIRTALSNKHYSIFEHLYLVFVFSNTDCWGTYHNCLRELRKAETRPYFQVSDNTTFNRGIISINYRFLFEAYNNGYCLIDPMVQAVYSRWSGLFSEVQVFPTKTDVKVYTSEEFYKEFYLAGQLSKEEKEKHLSFSFILDTDRAVMAELTRHRLNAFSCSSTRYINFNKKYGGLPITKQPKEFTDLEVVTLERIENCYGEMIKSGERAEVARNILPNVLWTQIFTTANLAQWNHVIELRTAKVAHPQIRRLTKSIKEQIDEKLSVFK